MTTGNRMAHERDESAGSAGAGTRTPDGSQILSPLLSPEYEDIIEPLFV